MSLNFLPFVGLIVVWIPLKMEMEMFRYGGARMPHLGRMRTALTG